jgi:aryl-alcohol dehydrogenase-like predicted oxidoreductase
VELGVNWVDTAAVYGLGHSEEVVGRVMRSLPETSRPLIFTKCGLEWDPAEPSREWHEVTPDTVRRGVEDSLRRLGLDRIDLFQIHSPDDNGSPVEPAWEAMLELKHEGLVRAVGVSNFDVGLLDRCEALGHVDSLQPPFSLISRDTATDLLPWAAAHGTGVICYSPMKNGILTDSFGRERIARMAEDDWRRSAPNFREPALGRNLALRDALRPIAERHNATVADVAVAWVLAWPGVSGAIVGGRAPEQVDGWVGAGGLTLSSADLDEIAAAVESTSAGSGPARPRR